MTPINTAIPNKILGETPFEADQRRYTSLWVKIVNNTKRLFRKTCFNWIFFMLVPLLYSSLLGNTAQWFDQPGECPQQTLWQQFDHLLKSRLCKRHQFG